MPPKLAYTPLERVLVPKPVDRIEYLRRCCSNKVVLDLGALDETAMVAKRGKGTWVHEELTKVASRVIGIDSSEKVPEDGIVTGANSIILRATVEDIPTLLRERLCVPDVVVAGELIEHLADPLSFLRSLRQQASLAGKTLLITTPNATALHNVMVGLLSRESTHPDHLCILSFKTLNTLFMRSGFSDWEIIPYYARFTEMRERNGGSIRKFVGIAERLVNAGEWLFPILSFGWVARVKI